VEASEEGLGPNQAVAPMMMMMYDHSLCFILENGKFCKVTKKMICFFFPLYLDFDAPFSSISCTESNGKFSHSAQDDKQMWQLKT
jgi:hypothetical protein